MKKNGFTLIELMIVVTIIGILAAVAIPAYQDYTKIQVCMKNGGSKDMCTEKVRNGVVVESKRPLNGKNWPEEKNNTATEPQKPKVECIEGYKFVNGAQLIGSSGGVPCFN